MSHRTLIPTLERICNVLSSTNSLGAEVNENHTDPVEIGKDQQDTTYTVTCKTGGYNRNNIHLHDSYGNKYKVYYTADFTEWAYLAVPGDYKTGTNKTDEFIIRSVIRRLTATMVDVNLLVNHVTSTASARGTRTTPRWFKITFQLE